MGLVFVVGCEFEPSKNEAELNSPKLKERPKTNEKITTQAKDKDFQGNSEIIYNEDGSIDTSNWQTYRNEDFGFEIELPSIDENDVEEGTEIFVGSTYNRKKKGFQTVSLRIKKRSDYRNNLNEGLYSTILSEEPVQIGHLVGIKYEVLNTAMAASEEDYGKTIFHHLTDTKSEFDYYLSCSSSLEYEFENNKVCEKVVSGFKFFGIEYSGT